MLKKFFEKKYLPLILVEIYLVLTLLLFQFGPINWELSSPFLFWGLIISYHLAFIVGYIFVNKRHDFSKQDYEGFGIKNFAIKYFWIYLIICAFCSIIVYRNVTHQNVWIPTNIINEFVNGLINPGAQYYLNLLRSDYEPIKLLTAVFAVFSFIYTSMMPLGVYLWKDLKWYYKLSFLLLVFFYFAIYISIGTNKGIFNILFLLGGSLFIFYFTDDTNTIKSYIQNNKTIFMISIFLLVFSILYFGWTISSRTGSMQEVLNKSDIPIAEQSQKVEEKKPATSPKNEENNSQGTGEIGESDKQEKEVNEKKNEKDSSVSDAQKQAIINETKNNQNSGNFMNNLIYGVTNYVTQGYYGMSLSINKPFTSTYGIGHSDFLKSNFKSVFGIDVTERTYQYKTHDTWNYKTKWHSFYSYWANDISYLGVIILMFIIGAYTALLWNDLIVNKNMLAMCLLPLLIIMFINMPGNNMIFTGMQTFCAFWEFSIIYFLLKFINFKKNR